MPNLRIFLFLFIAASSFHTLLAQNESDQQLERQKQASALLDKVLSDARLLKLAENRAFIFAKTGALIWRKDEKRARALFDEAIAELNSPQLSAEFRRRMGWNLQLYWRSDLRRTLLDLIAQKSGELALDYMIKTRSPEIRKSMLPQEGGNGENSKWDPSELSMEQSFIKMALHQESGIPIETVKKSIMAGVTINSIGTISALIKTDPETANSLANNALEKLIKTPIRVDNAHLFYEFLRESTDTKRPPAKSINFNETSIRLLANRFADALQNKKNGVGTMGSSNPYFIEVLEKIIPARAAELKQKLKPGLGNADEEREQAALKNLLAANPTAEALYSESKAFKTRVRSEIITMAANKFAEEGNIGRARDILTSGLSNHSLEAALSNLDERIINIAIKSGRQNDALELIENLAENSRIPYLANLAINAANKLEPENRQKALSILEEGFKLLPANLESRKDFENAAMLLNTSLMINRRYDFTQNDRIGQIAERMVKKVNEIIEAQIIADKFRGNVNSLDGEVSIEILRRHYDSFPQLRPMLFDLAKTDYGRAIELSDLIQRNEVRLLLQLDLLDRQYY